VLEQALGKCTTKTHRSNNGAFHSVNLGSDVAVLNQGPVVISQWAIFTIRNLLEHNTQNQDLVAALERRGTADYSALKELGFVVEKRDGGLLLKTVRKDT